jgi:hypothetical protein
LGRPIIVLDLTSDGSYGRLARVFGERGGDGCLFRRDWRSNDSGSIQAYTSISFEDLLQRLAASPAAVSLLRFDGHNHFEPFVLSAPVETTVQAEPPAGHAAQIGAVDPIEVRLAELGARWGDDNQTMINGTDATRERMDQLCTLLDELQVDGMLVLVPGFEYNFSRSSYGARRLNWTSQMLPPADGDSDGDPSPCPRETVASGEGGEAEEEPIQPPQAVDSAFSTGPQPTPASQGAAKGRGGKRRCTGPKGDAERLPAPLRSAPRSPRSVTIALAGAPAIRVSRNGRVRKAPGRFGHGGELEGKASEFRSAPLPLRNRKAWMNPGAPSFCLPGCTIWARGWLSGGRSWFKARIIKLRRQRPINHVLNVEAAQGNANSLALPNLKEAYVNASDVATLT